MGLFFSCLNGNKVPDILPPELVPASARNLGNQVGFLKDLPKNDTNVRATSSSPASRAPQRSFHENATAADCKGGTVYRHDDTEIKAYKSASRHIDRSRVRFGEDSPSGDLEKMKPQLVDASRTLDKVNSRSAADNELDCEMDNLKGHIRRVQDDLEHVSRGPRTSAEDQERWKLERELLKLQHERIPHWNANLKTAIGGARTTTAIGRVIGTDTTLDTANGTAKTTMINTSETETEIVIVTGMWGTSVAHTTATTLICVATVMNWNDPVHVDTMIETGLGCNHCLPSRSPSPPPRKARTPAPTATGPSADAPPPMATPPPPATPTPSKGKTKEERVAWLRAQMQARLQERMHMYGVPGYLGGDVLFVQTMDLVTIDAAAEMAGTNPVEERLEAEREEAEEKAKKAEREAEEREEKRAGLEEARGGSARGAAPTPPAPAAPVQKATPPTPTSRGAAKPPALPVAARNIPKPPTAPAPVASTPLAAPLFEDEENEELKRREKLNTRLERRPVGLPPPAPPALAPAAHDTKRGLPPPVRSRGSVFKQPEPTPEPAVPDEEFEAPAPPPPAPPPPAPPAAVAGRTNPFFNRGAGAPAVSATTSPAANPWSAPALAEPEVASPPPPAPPAPPAPTSPALPAPARTPTIVAPVASKEAYNKPVSSSSLAYPGRGYSTKSPKMPHQQPHYLSLSSHVLLHISLGPSNTLPPLPHAPMDLIAVVSLSPPSACASTTQLKLRIIRTTLDFLVASLGARNHLALVTFQAGKNSRVRKTLFLSRGKPLKRVATGESYTFLRDWYELRDCVARCVGGMMSVGG
ncbi:actin organization and endocytosis protein [Ceratobasidium sp. 428]|nr:actin organization and endocytosis protein [Ceratobasidium sp. 428]